MKTIFLDIREAFLQKDAAFISSRRKIIENICNKVRREFQGTYRSYYTQLGCHKSTICEFENGERLVANHWQKAENSRMNAHSHKYDFSSIVLKGSALYSHFEISCSNPNSLLYRCDRQADLLRFSKCRTVSATEVGQTVLESSSVFDLSYKKFHTVAAEPGTTTLTFRSRPIRCFSEVLTTRELPKNLDVFVD